MSALSTMPMRLVGDRFELVPAQSAFGCLLRITRLNQLKSADFRSFFGLYVGRDDDLNHILATSPRRRQAMAAALKLELPDTWDPGTWKPYREHQVTSAVKTPLRYCMACIRLGYHCYIHQLPWISNCPWHGVNLRTNCPRCDGRLATTSGAGRKLLTCSCGMDLLNESAAARLSRPVEGAERYLDAYLTWAKTMRHCQVLVGAPPVVPSSHALSQLVKMPATLRRPESSPSPTPARAYQRDLPPERLSPAEDARRMMGLRDDVPRMLHLPRFMENGCASVARETALTLPAGSLSPRERTFFLGMTAEDSEEPLRPQASAVVCSLPPLAIGDQRFLNLQSIHPVCARFLVHLEDAFAIDVPGLAADLREQTLGLLRRVQSDVLCRHYSEGLRAILARYVPQLYAGHKGRLQLTVPLALARLDGDPCVWMAFTSMSTYEDANDLLTASTGLKRTQPREK